MNPDQAVFIVGPSYFGVYRQAKSVPHLLRQRSAHARAVALLTVVIGWSLEQRSVRLGANDVGELRHRGAESADRSS